MPRVAERNPGRAAGGHARRLAAGTLAALYPAFGLLPLGLTALRDVAPADPWELAAAALGMVALATMSVQFVTSGRFQVVSAHLGIDCIMAFHKVAVWWVLLALLVHPLAYVLPTWLDNPALGTERLVAYLSLSHYRSGVIALAALLLLVASSVLRDRLPWRYEVWRASHVVLALTAVVGGLHHAVTAGRFSALGAVQGLWWAVGAVVLGLVATLYGWRWLRLRLRPWRLRSLSRLADRMWELDIQPAPGTLAPAYHAGQFVWMTEGARRFPLFDHPFSIAGSPTRPGLNLIVKEVGDFTRRIGTLAPGTPIGIDGPYGSFTLEAHQGDAVLLLAGGVGIAPIMGLLRDLVARNDPRPVRLAYAAGQPKNFACLDEIEAAKCRLDLQVMLLSEKDAPGWNGLVGRLDRDRLSQMLSGIDPVRSVALICGPGPMVTDVSDRLVELGMPMPKVIYERFDYSTGPSHQDRRRRSRFLAFGAALALGILLFLGLS